MDSYLELLAAARPGVNVAPQLGYGTGLHLGLAETGSLADANRVALRHVDHGLGTDADRTRSCRGRTRTLGRC
jgi:hypothetical protein